MIPYLALLDQLTEPETHLLGQLLADEWDRCEGEKGYGDDHYRDRQLVIEGLQARLKEAL